MLPVYHAANLWPIGAVGAYLAGCHLPLGQIVPPIWGTALHGVVFVAALKLMQVIVYARVFSATGLLAGSTGVVLGVVAMRWQTAGQPKSLATQPKNSLPRIGLILAGVIALGLLLELFASH